MAQRMPSCVGLSNRQIWTLFLRHYGQELGERELRVIHQRWIDAAAYAGFVRVRGIQKRDAPSP